MVHWEGSPLDRFMVVNQALVTNVVTDRAIGRQSVAFRGSLVYLLRSVGVYCT